MRSAIIDPIIPPEMCIRDSFPTVADQLLTVTGLMPQELISIYTLSGVRLATIEADLQGTV